MKYLLLTGFVFLQGCVLQVTEYAVNAYCAAPAEARAANRILVNANVYPNTVKITCGDETNE